MTSLTTKNRLVYLLPFIWFIINLIQGYFTEISNDESYYWMYAQYLDWGYFDHPPMIALMIKIGYSIFPNELGARLITVLLSSLTLYILFLINDKKQVLTMFLIFVSIAIFQAYSIIAVPDSPMLFFTALLLYFFQQYLQKDSYGLAMALGIAVAFLLYSKYHGILVVFFIVIANLNLLKRRSFYLIVLVSILVYLPHIYWQIINDYPSYQFHVLSKSHDPYRPLDSLMYLLGQLVVFGPLIGFIFFGRLVRKHHFNAFEKTLKFLVVGFIFFFFVSTFNSHGELNWTGVAVIPAILLLHRWLSANPSRFFKPLVIVSLLIFVVARVHLMHSIIPNELPKKSEFHQGKSWANNILEKAGDTPVVFNNSYQDASKYAFYTRKLAHSLNNSRYRKNQYDMWNIEEQLQGKKVMVVYNWHREGYDSLITNRGIKSISFDSAFYSYTKINFNLNTKKIKGTPGEKISLQIVMQNGYDFPVSFNQGEGKVDLHYEILKNGKFVKSTKIQSIKNLELVDTLPLEIEVQAPMEKGKHYLKFTINTERYGPFINSRFIPFMVE